MFFRYSAKIWKPSKVVYDPTMPTLGMDLWACMLLARSSSRVIILSCPCPFVICVFVVISIWRGSGCIPMSSPLSSLFWHVPQFGTSFFKFFFPTLCHPNVSWGLPCLIGFSGSLFRSIGSLVRLQYIWVVPQNLWISILTHSIAQFFFGCYCFQVPLWRLPLGCKPYFRLGGWLGE